MKANKTQNNILFEKVDSIILRNFHDYWKDPLINKYFLDNASDKYEGFLILRKQKKPVFLVHSFNYLQLKKEAPKNLIIEKFENTKELENKIRNTIGKKLGYNGKYYSVKGLVALKKICKRKLIDVSDELMKEKEIKSEKEIALIEKAAQETEKVILESRSWLSFGITEKELEKKIRRKFEDDGFETAFCKVSFGKNTVNIHHNSGETKLEYNMPVMIDAGAKYKGYCADMTRTFFFGKETTEFSIIDAKVKLCMTEIEKKLKPGTNTIEFAKIVKNFGIQMPHALGHGIGVEVHDSPNLIFEKEGTILKKGMVIAIEPAIYSQNFGYRYENDYLITKNSHKRL